jgi:hypothetical protein
LRWGKRWLASMSSSFNPATRNASRTLLRDTTLEYVIDPGASVVCPPATNRALRVKSIFTSNITWHRISWYPIIDGSLPARACLGDTPSAAVQATFTLSISFPRAFRKNSVPIWLSIARASATVFGNIMPNLWAVCQ